MNEINSNEKVIKWIVIFASVLVLAGTLIYVAGMFDDTKAIDVQGTSEFDVSPNKVDLYIEVRTNSSSQKVAQDQNSVIVEKVVSSLKQAGISEDKIQTISFNLGPKTYWDVKEQKLIENGFEAVHQIKVEVTDLSSTGKYLDWAINAGATGINSVNVGLTVEKENEAKQKALEAAAINARSKAQGIASGLGMHLKGVKRVSESNYYVSPFVRSFDAEGSILATKQAVADTVIATGTLKVTGNVHVSYELN